MGKGPAESDAAAQSRPPAAGGWLRVSQLCGLGVRGQRDEVGWRASGKVS